MLKVSSASKRLGKVVVSNTEKEKELLIPCNSHSFHDTFDRLKKCSSKYGVPTGGTQDYFKRYLKNVF